MAEATPTDSFRRATDAMRDTTKWLVTILPGASAATIIIQLAPALSAVSPHSAAFRWVVVLLVASVAAAAITVITAAYVLAAEVPGLGDAMKMADSTPTFLSDLDEQGVLRPYGYTTSTFFAAMADAPSADAARQAAITVVADAAAHKMMRVRFKNFLSVWVMMLVVVVVTGALAQGIRAESQIVRVTSPTPIRLIPTPVGWGVLTSHSCRVTTRSPIAAWAVGGDFREPEIVTDAEDCVGISLSWNAKWGAIVPTPTPSGP